MSGVGSALALAAWAAYVLAARAQPRWSRARAGAFGVGAALLAAALSPPVAVLAHHDLPFHMVQHVAMAMVAPLALVLGAPVTLALRALPVVRARQLVGALRSAPMRAVSNPVVALVLNAGGMAAFYLTPLFGAAQASPALHALVQAHMVAAGGLFAWSVLAGPDPCPHPARRGVRIGVLVAGIAAHAILAKWMYGYGWPRGFSTAETQAAALVMYYGGDLAELALAAAFFWRPRRRSSAQSNSVGGRTAAPSWRSRASFRSRPPA